MQSLNNSSNVPLRGSAIYIGSWDDILKYQNVQITLYSDSDCEITYYTSNDKSYIDSVTYSYVSGSDYFNSINSSSRYVYFTVRNTTLNPQTIFNFSVLYKDSPVTSNSGASDVTIIGPLNGDGSVFVGGDVNITNSLIDVSDSLTHIKLTNIYDLLDTKTNATLWSAAGTGVNGVSNAVNFSALKITNVTFMGNCNNATLLTVQFSNDGITYYDSQYSYNLTGAGDFGFNLACCPNYLRMKSSQNVTATVIVNAS